MGVGAVWWLPAHKSYSHQPLSEATIHPRAASQETSLAKDSIHHQLGFLAPLEVPDVQLVECDLRQSCLTLGICTSQADAAVDSIMKSRPLTSPVYIAVAGVYVRAALNVSEAAIRRTWTELTFAVVDHILYTTYTLAHAR